MQMSQPSNREECMKKCGQFGRIINSKINGTTKVASMHIAIPNYLRLKGFKPPITDRKITEGLPPMFVRHFRIAPPKCPT